MIEDKDYILKIVRKLAEVLASAFKKRQELRYDEAAQELEEAYREHFGMDPRFVHLMDRDAVRAALRHPARIEAFANLLKEHAKLLEDLHDARSVLLTTLADRLATVH